LRELPEAVPAWIRKPRSCNGAGPVYYHDLYPDSESKFPKSMDSTLFTFDWNNGNFTAVKVSPDGNVEWEESIFQKHRFVKPNDVALGANGELYVLEYGNIWYNGNEGKLKRVTYSKEPIQIVSKGADPRLEGLPAKHIGTKLIGAPTSTCLACHQVSKKSIGPSFSEIAKKYKKQKNVSEYLAKKMLEGSVGVWGEQPMPPNVLLKQEEALQIADAILGIKAKRSGHHK